MTYIKLFSQTASLVLFVSLVYGIGILFAFITDSPPEGSLESFKFFPSHQASPKAFYHPYLVELLSLQINLDLQKYLKWL